MDAQSVNNLVDIMVTALLAALQLLAITFHIKLPTSIQALLDARIPPTAGGGGIVPESGVTVYPPVRQTCLPWLGTNVLLPQRQTVQELPQGSEQETWWNDCGETCVSMVIEAVWGIYVPPDVLRVRATGIASSGLTTPRDLYVMLQMHHVSSQERAWHTDDYQPQIAQALKDGRPVIALGRWPTPGGVLHWLLVDDIRGGRVYYLNPWSGARSWLSFSDWELYSTDDYVEVQSHMHFEEDIPF